MSEFDTRLPCSPDWPMAMPAITDMIISARMLDLDISPTKSLVVTMLTKSMPPPPALNFSASSMVTPCAGLNKVARPTIPAAGISAITMETVKITPMMRPSFFRSVMPAIEDITLTLTNGTMIINSRLRNILPIACNFNAISGAYIPTIPPSVKANNRIKDDL
ncbi:hypothetical protein D3C77_607950 [compost metagenome]